MDSSRITGTVTRPSVTLQSWYLDRPPSHQYHKAAPHPIARLDHIDDNGNLRAADIGITWQRSETVSGWLDQTLRNLPYDLDRRRRRLTCWRGNMLRVTCQHHPNRYNRHAWRSQTDQYTGTHRRVVRATDRPPPFSASRIRA